MLRYIGTNDIMREAVLWDVPPTLSYRSFLYPLALICCRCAPAARRPCNIRVVIALPSFLLSLPLSIGRVDWQLECRRGIPSIFPYSLAAHAQMTTDRPPLIPCTVIQGSVKVSKFHMCSLVLASVVIWSPCCCKHDLVEGKRWRH